MSVFITHLAANNSGLLFVLQSTHSSYSAISLSCNLLALSSMMSFFLSLVSFCTKKRTS